MEEAAGEGDPPMADVRLCGHLRKQKSQRRRFFVLRAPSERGPARLEYYESEKKFGAGGARPKRSFPLASALNINKRADARHRHLIVLYGRDGTFGVAAESPEQQEAWYRAMTELRAKAGGLGARTPGFSPRGAAWPFREVWQVSLRPRGLGQARNLVGVHRLCLAESTVELVQLSAPAPCLVLQLLSVRRCGHSENYFFLEVGRSAATGPGELWMQVEDLVVARHIHETILEAMKRLSEECRVRGRGQASAPISVPARRLPPTQPPGSGRRRPDGDYPHGFKLPLGGLQLPCFFTQKTWGWGLAPIFQGQLSCFCAVGEGRTSWPLLETAFPRCVVPFRNRLFLLWLRVSPL
uniref:Insulin receptor substrate 1-like n=1 Tax=Terrapene triunguis TaxID=2587831 RepID=A0A674KBJ1_9SAUR